MKEMAITILVCFLTWQAVQVLQTWYARTTLNACYQNAMNIYTNQWNGLCKQNHKKDGCWLNVLEYSGIEEQKDKNINLCVKVFENNR